MSTGRAGVPMEVMGLVLGEFVDDYTVKVVDVFAMPQSGTGVSVEAVDPVFQTKMLDMLKQVGRCAPGGYSVVLDPRHQLPDAVVDVAVAMRHCQAVGGLCHPMAAMASCCSTCRSCLHRQPAHT